MEKSQEVAEDRKQIVSLFFIFLQLLNSRIHDEIKNVLKSTRRWWNELLEGVCWASFNQHEGGRVEFSNNLRSLCDKVKYNEVDGNVGNGEIVKIISKLRKSFANFKIDNEFAD